ncbi:hypothetical protein D3C76_960340 [compost metagenome]
MIDIYTWPPLVRLLCSIAPFVISLTGVAISSYVAISREFDVINSSFRSNAYLEGVKYYHGTKDFYGRWMVVCSVCGILAFAGYLVRRGDIEADELSTFPDNIRRRLVFSVWLTAIGMLWLTINVVLVEISKGR